jgi:hypothetical protein
LGVEVSESIGQPAPIRALRARTFTVPAVGALEPGRHAPGQGLRLREDEAERFEH